MKKCQAPSRSLPSRSCHRRGQGNTRGLTSCCLTLRLFNLQLAQAALVILPLMAWPANADTSAAKTLCFKAT